MARKATTAALNSSAWLVLIPWGPCSMTTKLAARDRLVGALPGDLQGHDGVAVAVDDQRRDGDSGQVAGEVGDPRPDALDGGVDVGLGGQRNGGPALLLGHLEVAVGAEEVGQ